MRLPSKSTAFVVLMIASAISVFLLPGDWLRRFFQPLSLLQSPVSAAGRSAEEWLSTTAQPGLSTEQTIELREEVARLRREVAGWQARVEEQQVILDELTGLAGQSPDNLATIVLAPVVSYDADPRRETFQVMLSKLARPHVHVGQWVAAGVRVDPSRRELLRHWLVGRIASVHTHVATVQLVTDPGFKERVVAARTLADGTWQLADRGCRLLGKGAGRMLIDQAERDYYRDEYRTVVVPASRDLPFPLSVGRITESQSRSDSPQHVDLVVSPWGRLEEIAYVYIISTGE